MTDQTSSAVRAAVAERFDDWLAGLIRWAAIPSVSADPAHRDDVAASAAHAAEMLRASGFPDVRVVDGGPWQPAVLARWPSGDPDAVRVVVYGHHDVQPADGADRWSYPPFEPVVVDGVLHGRGVSDDKGNVGLHALGVQAHLAATGRSAPAVDLTVLVEGEEESGSPHIGELLEHLREELVADVIVVSDAGIFRADTPSLVVSMRGLVSGELRVHGPDVDLHSGQFGGAVPNPATVLARLVASLHDDDGRIAVPGFYDDVRDPGPEERAATAALPFDEQGWLRGAAASRATHGEAGWTTLERTGARPTAEVNGIVGGYTGPGGKTIVPTDALAKLSFRLVGDQDPADIQRKVTEHLTGRAPDGVEVEMYWDGPGVRPVTTELEHPATRAAQRATAAAFDTDTVLLTREGGSGPEADLVAALQAPMVFLGVMTPEDRIHAPDERAELALLRRGAEAIAHLWQELAELGRAGLAAGTTAADARG